jgi:hypothetical protein
MRHIFTLLTLITLLSCHNGRQCKKNLETKTDSALWSIVDKYNIKYQMSINETRDSVDIIKRFPLVKTISFPEGINVEFRQYFDCHEHLELILFYDSNTVSIIPFYGIVYYKLRIKKVSNEYITAFEVELNKTFLKMNDYMKKGNRYDKFRNSIFLQKSSFVNFIMTGLYHFDFQKIYDTCQLDYYRKNIESLDFKELKIPYSKKQALDNLAQLKVYSDYDLYGTHNDMIFKFKYSADSSKENYIKVDAINNETYREWIW